MSESDYDRVWEIMDDIAVCMVTTHAGGRMRSRPMHAVPDRPAGCIYFVTDTRGAAATSQPSRRSESAVSRPNVPCSSWMLTASKCRSAPQISLM